MSRQLGRYELLRPIGRGGMAEVWLAQRRGVAGVQKRLVVKRILREHARDPRLLELFVQEAQVSMALSHKNIVPVFDFGRVGDELFLVMELVDGPNWRQALGRARKRERMPEPLLAAHVIFEACQALDYAHHLRDDQGSQREIAHRDVTPSNILLSFSGEVKLADFGLAVATAEVSDRKTGVQGTPSYMAPEQARGEPATAVTDLYSLGVVLLEALTGTSARQGEIKAQLAQAREGHLPELPETVPQALREIIAHSTRPLPCDRYASAREMASALDDFILAERSKRTSSDGPLSRQLAAWIDELFPDGLPVLTTAAEGMQGHVATFLDDGADGLLEAEEQATMRSLAETVVEGAKAGDGRAATPSPTTDEPTTDEPTTDQPTTDQPTTDDRQPTTDSRRPITDQPTTDDRTGGRARWLFVLVPALVASAAALWIAWPQEPAAVVHRAETDAGAPTRSAAPIDAAAPFDAAPPVDAAPLVDAAFVPATTDARVRRPKPDARVETARLSTIQVSSAPWAKVTVVGRSEHCDETPCELHLPPGRYTLRWLNPVAGLEASAEIVVEDGKDQTVSRTLHEPRPR